MAASLLSLSNFVPFLSTSSNTPTPQLSSASSGFTGRQRLVSGLSTGVTTPVVYPSLANSGTVCFNSSSYNVEIIVEEDEPEERLVGRFRREVFRAGIIQECRRRRYFENKQDEKKRRTREAAKKNRKRRPMSRFDNQPSGPSEETKKVVVDDGDNWELPAGGIPY
ncbi:30S ribosomal protein S21, chloroplastic [Linum grandiflorum]